MKRIPPKATFDEKGKDLDSLAGAVSYRHCLPPALISAATSAKATDDDGNAAASLLEASAKAGLYLATASADRIDMFGSLDKEHIQCVFHNGARDFADGYTEIYGSPAL